MAVDKYWVCGSDSWDVASCWSASPGGAGGAGQPSDGDFVYLVRSDASDRTVTYANTLYPSAHLDSLTVDATGLGTVTVLQAQDPLWLGYEFIGLHGTGTFTQTGGTHQVTTHLYLGWDSSSSGTYDLSGTGNLSADAEYVGLYGTGTFTQTGGTNQASSALYLGTYPAGSGTDDLFDGSLSAAGYEYIGYSGTGTFNQTGGTNQVSHTLDLGVQSDASGTYDLFDGSLSADEEYIGSAGTGTFTQTGGTNQVSHTLRVGRISDGSGTYDLSGTGGLSANDEYIGVQGTGNFIQTGGANQVTNNLFLALNGGSSGTYALSNGSLSVGGWEYIGSAGMGTFAQTGGTHQVTHSLYLAGASGTYNLFDGSLSADEEYIGIGNGGIGAFTQTGGTNAVTSILTLASQAGSSGTYNLNGGDLTVGGLAFGLGSATFDWTAGTLNGSAVLTIGNGAPFGASLAIDGNDSLSAPNETIATEGTITQSGGNHTVANALAVYGAYDLTGGTLTVNGTLDNNGTLTILGGTLAGSGLLANNNVVAGFGAIGGSGGFTNNATVTQSGGHLTLANTGANANYGTFDLGTGYQLRLAGADLTNGGTLNLNGAVATGTGILNNTYGGTITGHGTIASGFANSGGVVAVSSGTTNITNPFASSGTIRLSGPTANLVGGTISNTGTIEGQGNIGSALSNGGTVEALGGTLSLSGVVSNEPAGIMAAATGSKLLIAGGLNTNEGVISLSGGTFDNNGHPLTNEGQISGHGTVRTGGTGLSNVGHIVLTGGNTTVNGNVTNQVGGSVEVAHNPAIFTGDVVNHGTVKVTNTNLTFAGSYTENGLFISDPATTTFLNDLVIGGTGALMGGIGDEWLLMAGLLSNSTAATVWETGLAELTFSGAYAHDLMYTGADLGNTGAGWQNNYAWGVLELGSGVSLNLLDGDAIPGMALYADLLVFGDGTSQISSIFGGAGTGIYYHADNPGNAFLGGATYALSGGAFLAPASSVPEPTSMVLLASAVGLLATVRRQTRRAGMMVAARD